jgi:putative SOS response-associated peptidase YedK
LTLFQNWVDIIEVKLDGIIALAGLSESWRSPAGGWGPHLCDHNHPAKRMCAELHNRMPAVLKPEMWPAWLGENQAAASD